MNIPLIIISTIFIITIKCSNIDSYLERWCSNGRGPFKIIDFQPFLTDDHYKKEVENKCGIWFRHIPNKNWTNNFTKLLTQSSKQLKVLKISDGLEDIDEKLFSLAMKLEILDLSGNNLSHLRIEENTVGPDVLRILSFLERLDLSNNNFTNIEFIKTECSFLYVLDLTQNQLEAVPVASLRHFPRLKELILKRNLITKFGEDSSQYPNIEILDLSSNRLNNLDGLRSFNKLVVLRLTDNSLSALSPKLFNFEIRSLEDLDLDHNEIKEITSGSFKNFPNLKNLKLDHNKISKLESDVFVDLKQLVSLDISHNLLTKLDDGLVFSSQVILRELNFRNNLVNKFDYVNIISPKPFLRKIDLSGNSFNCDEFEKMLLFLKGKAKEVISEGNCLFNENQYKNGTNEEK